MKAIILSAGKGTRMLPLTKDRPKALLEISNGKTIIESQLENLRSSGVIDEVVFVVGYRHEMIREKAKLFTDIKTRFIYNPFYDCSNNLISLWAAIREMNESFIVINGDNVFKDYLVRDLVKNNSDSPITMVIDRKDNYDDDDMKVFTHEDRILKVSKKIPLAETNGESIGMMSFCGDGIPLIIESIERLILEEKNKNIFYLAALQQLMNDGHKVGFHECEVKDWAEVDFHPDLKLIQDYVSKNDNFF